MSALCFLCFWSLLCRVNSTQDSKHDGNISSAKQTSTWCCSSCRKICLKCNLTTWRQTNTFNYFFQKCNSWWWKKLRYIQIHPFFPSNPLSAVNEKHLHVSSFSEPLSPMIEMASLKKCAVKLKKTNFKAFIYLEYALCWCFNTKTPSTWFMVYHCLNSDQETSSIIY